MQLRLPFYNSTHCDQMDLIRSLLGKYPHSAKNLHYIFTIPDEDLLLLRMKHPNLGDFIT